MRECPLTGKLCNKATLFKITDIKDGKVTSSKCCEDCFSQYIQNDHNPIKEEASKLDFGKEPDKPVTAGEVVQGLLELMNNLSSTEPSPKPKLKPEPKPEIPKTMKGRKCPGCKSTLYDIADIGKVGCAQCFEVFKKPLDNVLIKAHGSTEHIGKKPKIQESRKVEKENKKPKRKLTTEVQISNQEIQMKEAIDVENYERAAALRDSLKLLREKMKEEDVLRQNMDEAVKAEDFEKASEIKKKLDELR